MTAPATLGERIRAARVFAGMSREQLGRAVDVSAVTIGRYERDTGKPRAPTLEAIGRETGVPASFLQEGFGTPDVEQAALREEVREVREALAGLRDELLGEISAIRAERAEAGSATPSPEHHAAQAAQRLAGSEPSSEGTPDAGDGTARGRG